MVFDREKLPRVLHSWLRNYVAVLALYFAVGGVWSYYIYWCFGAALFGPGKVPGMPDVLEQIKARPAQTSRSRHTDRPCLQHVRLGGTDVPLQPPHQALRDVTPTQRPVDTQPAGVHAGMP